MANLLPAEYQKKAKRIIRARFVLAASLMALGVALVAFVALVPSYLLVRATPVVQSAANVPPAPAPEDASQVAEAQFFVTKLSPLLAATTTPSLLVLAALAEKPTGISLRHISYSAAQGGASVQLILSGTATGVDLIDSYRAHLAADPHFSGASVPIGALVGDSAGNFTITVSSHP